MDEMKQFLLDFLKQATEVDIDRLPNIIFMRHLKDQLNKQVADFDYVPNSQIIDQVINTVLANFNVNFSALGPKCSEENNEYLLEIATLTAKCIWRIYRKIPSDLGFNVFIGQVKKFDLSLTQELKDLL